MWWETLWFHTFYSFPSVIHNEISPLARWFAHVLCFSLPVKENSMCVSCVIQSASLLNLLFQEGMKQCLADFCKTLPWVERLNLTNLPVADIVAKAEGRLVAPDGEINAEDDFQREMYLWVWPRFVKQDSTYAQFCCLNRSDIQETMMYGQVLSSNSEPVNRNSHQKNLVYVK